MEKMTGFMAGWLIMSATEAKKDYGFVVENGKIVEIVPNEKLLGKEGVIDARDSIVCPTFTNTHTHFGGPWLKTARPWRPSVFPRSILRWNP